MKKYLLIIFFCCAVVGYFLWKKYHFDEKIKIFFAVDQCLDAGGCWDKIENTCKNTRDHLSKKNTDDCKRKLKNP